MKLFYVFSAIAVLILFAGYYLKEKKTTENAAADQIIVTHPLTANKAT